MFLSSIQTFIDNNSSISDKEPSAQKPQSTNRREIEIFILETCFEDNEKTRLNSYGTHREAKEAEVVLINNIFCCTKKYSLLGGLLIFSQMSNSVSPPAKPEVYQ